MIIYKKLEKILQDRNMQWKSLCDAGISVNMPAKFSKNKPMNTDIINKVCEYLKVQPSEIMEWIPDEEYNKANEEIASIEAQIAECQEIAEQCEAEGYPSNGSNYELRCETARAYYDEQIADIDANYNFEE